MLCQPLLYSKVTQLYTRRHSFPPSLLQSKLFSFFKKLFELVEKSELKLSPLPVLEGSLIPQHHYRMTILQTLPLCPRVRPGALKGELPHQPDASSLASVYPHAPC